MYTTTSERQVQGLSGPPGQADCSLAIHKLCSELERTMSSPGQPQSWAVTCRSPCGTWPHTSTTAGARGLAGWGGCLTGPGEPRMRCSRGGAECSDPRKRKAG